MQSVYITTKVVSSNPADVEVNSIQLYVIKFVSYLRQVGGFLRVLHVFSNNNTDHHDIAGILLNVQFNSIALTPNIPYNNDHDGSRNTTQI
jgi:hypothetical protein